VQTDSMPRTIASSSSMSLSSMQDVENEPRRSKRQKKATSFGMIL